MNETPRNQIIEFGKFTIETSAVVIELFWFPVYQKIENNEVNSVWQRPACVGFPDCESAISSAIQYAINDVEFG